MSLINRNDNSPRYEPQQAIEVIFPILDNEKVDIMAMFRPFLNQNGLDSVMLTIWIEREDTTHLNPLVDEQAGKKVKDWLLSFYAQIDRTAITTD